MKKITTILILFVSMFLSASAQFSVEKIDGIIIATYGKQFLVKHYDKNKFSILDENGKLNEIKGELPESLEFIDCHNFNKDYFMFIMKNTGDPNFNYAIEGYKLHKDNLELEKAPSVIIDQYQERKNVVREMKLYCSEDSSKIYVLTYEREFNTGGANLISNFLHIVMDNQYEVIWKKTGYPSPGQSMQIQAVSNDGDVYFSSRETKGQGFHLDYYYYIAAFLNQGEDEVCVKLPGNENEIMNVKMFPVSEGVVLLSGFLKAGDSYFISYMIDMQQKKILGYTKEKFNLKNEKKYLGNKAPDVGSDWAHSLRSLYYRVGEEYLHVLHFLGSGDEASYVFMYINEDGKITDYQFLNNPQTSLQYTQRGDVLHFLYQDNIKNYTSKKIVELGKKEKEQCLTYVRYNIQTKAFAKEMIQKNNDYRAKDMWITNIAKNGFLVKYSTKKTDTFQIIPFKD